MNSLDPLVLDDAEELLRVLGDDGTHLWIGDQSTTATSPNYSALQPVYRASLYDRM